MREFAHQAGREQPRHARQHVGTAQERRHAGKARHGNRDITMEAARREPPVEVKALVVSIDHSDVARREIGAACCWRGTSLVVVVADIVIPQEASA